MYAFKVDCGGMVVFITTFPCSNNICVLSYVPVCSRRRIWALETVAFVVLIVLLCFVVAMQLPSGDLTSPKIFL